MNPPKNLEPLKKENNKEGKPQKAQEKLPDF
jgi:hypothetical protein